MVLQQEKVTVPFERSSFHLVRLTVALRSFFTKVTAALYWLQDTTRQCQDKFFKIKKSLPEFSEFLFSRKRFLVSAKVTTSSGILRISFEFLFSRKISFLGNRDVFFICLIPLCLLCQDSARQYHDSVITVSRHQDSVIAVSRQNLRRRVFISNFLSETEIPFFSVTEATTSSVTPVSVTLLHLAHLSVEPEEQENLVDKKTSRQKVKLQSRKLYYWCLFLRLYAMTSHTEG